MGRSIVPDDGEAGDPAIGLVRRPTLTAVDPNAL
jgi:hypothetical protein